MPIGLNVRLLVVRGPERSKGEKILSPEFLQDSGSITYMQGSSPVEHRLALCSGRSRGYRAAPAVGAEGNFPRHGFLAILFSLTGCRVQMRYKKRKKCLFF